jgi:ribosomal protein S18 acetylase RimI-like enzyme
MKGEVRLRRISDAEFAAYRELAIPSLAESEAKAFDIDLGECRTRAEAAFQRLVPDGKVSASGQQIYVVQHDETDIGVIWYELRNENRDAYVYDIVIWSQYRRRGFATSVFGLLEQKLRDSEVRRVTLNVFENNVAARSLYRILGYSPRAFLMMKKL